MAAGVPVSAYLVPVGEPEESGGAGAVVVLLELDLDVPADRGPCLRGGRLRLCRSCSIAITSEAGPGP